MCLLGPFVCVEKCGVSMVGEYSRGTHLGQKRRRCLLGYRKEAFSNAKLDRVFIILHHELRLGIVQTITLLLQIRGLVSPRQKKERQEERQGKSRRKTNERIDSSCADVLRAVHAAEVAPSLTCEAAQTR